jgi:hypothetical protein
MSAALDVVTLEADAPPAAAWVAIALGCVALAARHLTYESTFVTALVGGLGLLARGTDGIVSRARWIAVVAAGTAFFGIARLLASPVGIRVTSLGFLTLAIASVAEECFFRRYVYAWAARWGAGAAIGVAAVTFALVHVPMYGVRALPVDLAAGALLGWQRWAAGTWTAPALTHLVADFLQVG